MNDLISAEVMTSELEIRNLICRIAQLADSGPIEEYLKQFTEDAVWGGGRHAQIKGHKAIGDYALTRKQKGYMGPGTQTMHKVSTSYIEVSGERASGKSVYHYYCDVDTLNPRLGSLGVYSDSFQKVAGVWLLAKRIIGSSPTS